MQLDQAPHDEFPAKRTRPAPVYRSQHERLYRRFGVTFPEIAECPLHVMARIPIRFVPEPSQHDPVIAGQVILRKHRDRWFTPLPLFSDEAESDLPDGRARDLRQGNRASVGYPPVG